MGKGEQTRSMIVDQALALAAVEGLAALSIGELAKHTGLSKSGLFAHFGSKQALQQAVLEQMAQRFTERVVISALMPGDGVARLRKLFENYLSWAGDDQPAGCPLQASSTELDDQPGPLRDYLCEQQREWLELIARIAAKAVRQGDFKPDLDTAQFAFGFHAILLGYNFANRMLRDPKAGRRAGLAFEALIAQAAT